MSTAGPASLWSSACGAAIALAFLWMGVNGWYERNALEKNGQNIEAKVTNSRISHGKSGTSHQIQYVFQVEAGGKEHTRGDFLGRSNLWSTLPEAKWRLAVETERVMIRYASTRPENNAPVDQQPGLGDIWTVLILGGVLLVGVLLGCLTPRKHGEAA